MADDHLQQFRETFGPTLAARKVPAATVEAYGARLPELVVREWKEVGWAAYGEGLLWFTDPEDFVSVLPEFAMDPASACVFMRTAFGDLVIWNDKERVNYLHTHYGKVSVTQAREVWSYIRGSLEDPLYQKDVLWKGLFAKAKRKLGPIQCDEMYTFEPALGLGGKAAIENIRKVKLREQLSILAQITAQ